MRHLPLVLLAFVLGSCGAAQRPVTWDVSALATIHGTAHGLAIADDGAAAYYRSRTDALAADGGPDGAPLRGPAYLVATAGLDRTYTTFAHDLSLTRDGLVLAETLVRQAVALGLADLRCRAAAAVQDLVADLGTVAQDLIALGVAVDPSIPADAHLLAAVVTQLSGDGCADASAPAEAGAP